MLLMKSLLNLFNSVFVGLIILYLKINLILQITAEWLQQRQVENEMLEVSMRLSPNFCFLC